jgi:ankyrin repeat protein
MVRQGSVITLALVLASTTFGAVAPNTLPEAFYRAIRANDLTVLDTLVKEGGGVNMRDAEGVTPLMYAAAVGSIDAMNRLLAAGADVNARNTLGSSALTWATKDLAKVRLLLDHGADVNVTSIPGRTPLLVATMHNPSADVVKLLIARGADALAADKLHATALHTAAVAADIGTLRALLDAKVDVNARDAADFTPLMVAASNGSVEAVKLLLSRGARVNDVSGAGEVVIHAPARVKNGTLALGSFTALLLAAPAGSAELVKTLIDAGADVNATDIRGMTPLMLAVATDHYDLNKIRLLLHTGANLNVTTPEGETALNWAQKFGKTPVVALLNRTWAPAKPHVTAPETKTTLVDLPTAIARSTALLERTSSAQFFAKGGCAACHAQNIMDVAASVLRPKGMHLDDKEAASRLAVTKGRFVGSVPHLLERLDAPGTPDVPLFSIGALAAIGYEPDRMTDALAINVAAQQYADGRWHVGWTARPPIQDGDITRTALGIRMLRMYAPPALAPEMLPRLARAKRWMEAAVPITTEDRAMRILGLRWAGSNAAIIAKSAAALIATERADGGWAQRDELPSDAYATGQALYALAVGGRGSPTDAACRRGITFLLSTQQADGSWFVRSRSVKFQPYFESGFPYSGDQWISAMATGWAVSGLAAAGDSRSTTAALVR